MDLKSGNCTLVFEVTHTKTGYAVISETSLKVTTMFSEGFYILKETPEGNTDIDLFNADSEIQVEDILTSVHGAALTGKPGVLNIVYDMAHIDPATAKTDYASALFITAGDNNFSIYRANDMLKIFDRTNLLYGEMSEDDTPQYMCSGMYNLYFSSKGIRQAPSATWGSEYDTGKLGYPAGIGASNFVQACNGDGFIYWDFMQQGGRGVISVTANVAAEAMSQIGRASCRERVLRLV